MTIELIGLPGLPEITQDADLTELIAAALEANGLALADGDILVVAQKIVSKAEGAFRRLGDVVVSPRAAELGLDLDLDPRRVQVVLDESVRIVRDTRVLIVETRHGYICANAGVDHSNVQGDDVVTLLPRDPDASAARLRAQLGSRLGVTPGVIISDTFGRPWRNGITNVALGVAGLAPLIDYRGTVDDYGEPLTATIVAVADELAGAAELVMGKTNRVPVVLIRGYITPAPSGTGRDLLRPADEDLFR